MIGMKIPVNISNDLVIEGAVHCAPAFPAPNGSVAVAAQYHPPGFAAGKNKLTRTVKHKGMSVVQGGHDIGPLMPHLTFPLLTNPWYVKILPGSSCKVAFASSTVKVNGQPVGLAGLSPETVPMLTCAFPAPLPSAAPVTSSFNTVTAGMTFMDRVSGAVSLVVDMVVGGLTQVYLAGAPSPIPASTRGKLLEILKGLLPAPVADPKAWLVKQALGAAAGFSISSLTGDPSWSVGEACGLGQVQATVTHTPKGAETSYAAVVLGFSVSAGPAGVKARFWGEEL